MQHSPSLTTAIDAVITWVDGNDPDHKRKRRAALGELAEHSATHLSTANEKTRFIDNGEIRYTIASIRTFAPWIRTIFVVTDEQKPDFFTESFMRSNGIKLVDHREIFTGYEWALPTFNSRSIETVLWRIPELAERYIFFNDDFVLAAPVQPDDFFQGNDNIVVRGRWERVTVYGEVYMRVNDLLNTYALKWLGITRSLHLLYQMKSAEVAGYSHKYFRVPHVPHPVLTSTPRSFFSKNETLLVENLKYRFRDTQQFSSIFLANHLQIRENKAVLKDTREVLMLNGETDYSFVFHQKMRMLKSGKKRFICLQAVDKFSEIKRKEIYSYLDNLLGLDPID